MSELHATREKLLDTAFLEVYKMGYHGASLNSILAAANVPKGSMYYFFKSKKSLVLAVIDERIIPKMDAFFSFERQGREGTDDVLKRSFEAIADNKFLIGYGCPLFRLMVEMSHLDKSFERSINKGYKLFTEKLKKLLDYAIEAGEYHSFDTSEASQYMITSLWGRLSLSPELTSRERFLKHAVFVLDGLQKYRK